MTVRLLEVAPSDVSAGALGYRLGTMRATDALVSLDVDHPTSTHSLRLSILGASHAVTLMVDGEDVVTEEVSCRAVAAGGAPLPARASAPGPWGAHRLEGTTEALTAERFDALVAELETLAEDAEHVLAGVFPGRRGALTVVASTPVETGWRWQTWHLYPAEGGGGEVVTTHTHLEVAERHALAGAAS